MFDHANLHPIIEKSASFGNHHTGTDADRATTRWLVELLALQLAATMAIDAAHSFLEGTA